MNNEFKKKSFRGLILGTIPEIVCGGGGKTGKKHNKIRNQNSCFSVPRVEPKTSHIRSTNSINLTGMFIEKQRTKLNDTHKTVLGFNHQFPCCTVLIY